MVIHKAPLRVPYTTAITCLLAALLLAAPAHAASPPSLDPIGDKTIDESATLAITATATDPDLGETIAFALDAGAPAGAAINALSGAFSWTPTEVQGPGAFPITIRATDSGDPPLSAAETIVVTVNEINVAPVVAPIGNRTTTAGIAVTFTATATDADVPANGLTFSLDAGFPVGASIGSTTGAFAWTPTAGQVGANALTVRATDNGTPAFSGSQDIVITVNGNQPPVLASIGDRTVNELATLAFTGSAADPDAGQTVDYSLDAGAPAGATINTSTGAFSWSPTEAQGPGSFPTTIRATDDGAPALSDFEAIAVTVNEVNAAPVLAAIGNKTVNELATLAFTATATDTDLPANAVAFSLDAGAPAGAAINASTGAFSWTPTEAQGPGIFPITIRGTDDGTPALSDFDAITVTVNEVNVAPLVTNPGNQTVDELTVLAFTATATDVDVPANALTWSLDGAPAGAAIGASTGAFSWTPTEAQGPGSYPITIRATDNGTPPLNGSVAITITVDEVNAAPVVTNPGSHTVNELAALSFTATALDADAPANTLSWSLEGAPAGAAITASTGLFTWIPTEAQGPGSYPVTIRATDSGTPALSGAVTTTITVNEVNAAPALAAIGSKTINELATLAFTTTATDTDVPANTLTFSLDAGAPAGATVGATTGAFSWTPTEAQGPGAFPVTIRATDSGTPALSDFEVITVTVNEVNVGPALVAIGSKTVNELATIAFTATATDADVPANTMSWSLDAGAPAGATIGASTGVFSWTPTEAQGPGAFPVTIGATDNGTPALSDFEVTTVTVNEVNAAPVLAAIGNKTVNELTALAFTATATDADVPANTVAFSLDAGAPTGATIGAGSGAFSWTPTEAQGPGAFPVTIRATDNGTQALSDFDVITVTVNEVNAAPVVTDPGNKTVNELATLAFTATATDGDVPANTLSWSLDAGAPAGATIGALTGAFSWTPTEAQGPGSYPITIRATDNGSPALSDFQLITVTVNEVNAAPVVTSPGNKTVDELTALAFTVTATDTDVPANALTWSLDAGAPTGAAINASTGAFSWTPTETQGPGAYPVTIRATDNGTPALSGTSAITIAVNEANVAPIVISPGNETIDELANLAFTVMATDADFPANTLSWSLDPGAPAGASINSSTGAFSWTSTEAQGPGAFPITIRATDNGTPALSGTAAITVTVNEVNVAPTLAAIGNKTVNELVAPAFTATATDPDVPGTLTFSLDAGAPTGAAINASTGAFAWTPTETQGPGSYPITVRVTDNGTPALDDFETITVTVNEVNTAPVLTNPGNRTVAELSALTFTVTPTDSDIPANTMTWSLDAGAPVGSTINSGGAFSWTPTEAQGPGVYPVTIRATDNGTPALGGTTAITITVTEVNVAPVMTNPGNKTVNELSPLSFTATATDADVPANTFAWSLDAGAPAGAAIDAGTAAFSWTPTEAQGPGAYPVTIRATDSGTPALSDFQAITVTVNEVNTAPVVTDPGNRTVNELVALAFAVTATDSDVPANSMTWSLDAGAPAGAAINASTGAFSWTATEAQGPGAYPVTIRATDNGTPALAGTAAITITVSDVNSAPALNAIGNKAGTAGTAITFTATATDADVPANALSFSLDAGAPAGATIDAGTGAFAWTPSTNGGFPVTVRVTDNGTPALSDFETITITVSPAPNQAPLLGAIGNKTVNELSTLAFTATATDPDAGQTLTFSLDAGAPTGAAINGSTGAFSWTPTETQGPGSYPITVRVTDNGTAPLSDTEAITVTITEVNAAPALAAIGSKTVNELATLAFTATATDTDLPANTLIFSLDAGAPAGATINASTGAFSWTPTEAQGPGSFPITIRAMDNGTPALSDAETITVTVNEVNAAPVLIDPGDKTINEVALLAFTVTATDADVPANTLAWSLDAGAPAGAAINALTGAFSWTPTEAQGPGTYPITIRATDNGTPALSGSVPITVTVNEANAAPVVANPGNRTVDELTSLTFTATATDSDVPANTSTWSLDAGAPAGATINASTGAFSWTPTEAQGPGSFPITIRATDNGTPSLSGTAIITVTVNEVNSAPVVTDPGDKTVNELTALSFTVTAADPDLPANTRTFSLDAGAPTGAAINASTGAFSWTPTEVQGPGTYPITIRATDNGAPSLSGTATITVTVNEVNAAPVVTNPGNRAVNEQVALSFSVTATDSDLPADALTWSLDAGAPPGATINATTETFSWTPNEAQGPGTYPITIRAIDDGTPALSGTAAFTVTVNEVNRSPALTAIGNKVGTAGIPIAFTATATDPDAPANTIAFSLDAGAPAGATIGASTGAFSWTPATNGTFPVTVRVTDNGTPALSDFEAITIAVSPVPNEAPVLGAIGSTTVNELVALSFTATATDPNSGDILTFSLDAGAPTGAGINGATGAFTWTPTEAQGPGSYPITVRATDNGSPTLSDFETVTVTVNEVNIAPLVVNPGDKTINELTQLAFTAAAADGDVPANALSWSLDAGAPAGAAINASTGAFSWTPTETQGPGVYPVTIRATDNGTPPMSGVAALTITVSDVNSVPILAAIGDRTVNELAALAFTATATDADVPANTLSWSLDAGAPLGAGINASTGAFSWTPTEAQGPGVYPVTIRATDNGTPALSDAEGIRITVQELNVAPVVSNPGNKTVNELTAVGFTVTATDVDVPANTLSWSLDAGAPSGAAISASTGVFSWTPTEAQGPGVYPVTIRATDDGTTAQSGTAAVTITVNEVDMAPVLALIGDRTVNELAALTFTVTASDADLPANVLTFSLGAGAPTGAAINAATGAFSWTPSEAQGPAAYPITARVVDTAALGDSETITVTVNEVNASPIVTNPGNKTVNEQATLAVSLTATDPDIPANTLTWSLDAGAPAGAAINATTSTFSWTPTEAEGPGLYPMTVRSIDNGTPSLSGTATFSVTVNEVNRAPVLVTIGNKAGTVGVSITFTATATDADVPANTLGFSLDAGAPAGASINASSGAFSWTPSTNGNVQVTVRVTDNGSAPLSDAEVVTISVSQAPNRAPVLNAVGDRTVDELTTLAFTATATDPDAGDLLSFSLDAGAPAGASIAGSSGAFTWTPTEAQGPNAYLITTRVTDNGIPALSDFETISVTVNEVNAAPVVVSPGNRTVNELTSLHFTTTATDADVPPNGFSWSLDPGAPAGATIGAPTGAFTWTPTEIQGPGVFPVTIRATDNGTPALSATAAVTVNVNEVNAPPVLGAIGDRTVDELLALNFTATATDADLPANSLSFSLDAGAPAGATIDPVTGDFSWTPAETDGPGTYPITVRVSDNGTPTLSDFEAITVTVNETNSAPVLNPIGNRAGAVGVPITFTATATDADVPANSLSFSLDAGAPAGATIQPSTGVFAWTPGAAGDFPTTVRVTDNGAPPLSAFEAITITVGAAPNAPPVLAAIGDKTVNELAALAFTATAVDPDAGQTLTFSLDTGSPTGPSINEATGAFAWTPAEAQGPGSYPITVRVTDNGTGLLGDFEAITVTVDEVNASPVLAPIGNKTVTAGAPLAFTATATDEDIPANVVAFSLGAGAPAGATIDASTGAFSWTPSAAGVYPATIRATDNGVPPRSASEMIFINVGDPTNQAPILAAIGDKTIDESVRSTFTAAATDPDFGQTRAFTLDAGAPPGAGINPVTGVFTWTPTDAQGPGSYSVTVRVTDSGTPPLSDVETITITVRDVNAAPVLAAIGSKTVLPMVALTFTATATDPDIPVNTLTFSLDAGAPAGAAIDGVTGVFSWTPTATGSYPVTIRVTDDGTPPLSDFEAITIIVSEQAAATTLRQNSPNPFGMATRFDYRLQNAGHVRIALYDIRGREVRVLVDEDQGAGDHTATWDGKGRGTTPLASGLYICRMVANGVTISRRVTMAR